MIKIIYRLEDVIEFAWELSQNNLHASYPRRKSMKKIKDEMERAISSDRENVIAYYNQNVLCGVCVYHWDCDKKYAQTTQFLISGDYDLVADEFIDYIGKELPGYILLIGVPLTNKNANAYFNKRNVECVDATIDTRLCNLQSRIYPKNHCVEKITNINFEEYSVFHDKYAIPIGMYYNSKNLHIDMEKFLVFVFREDGEIHASLFIKTAKDISDIVGFFIDEEYKDKGIESILLNEMLMQLYNKFGEVEEVLYFIDEDCTNELDSALAAGFEIKDNYRCYKCIL
ncbi:MAG: hypothetical protein RR636_14275 [Clostridium sp.]|uniref:hypothetical protein n=1 Tax=Clostridium sp. TaxID=1506 RepID=UPI003046EF48